MYEDLIKALRNWAQINSLSPYERVLMKQAADAIEVLSKTEKTTQWIPVTERLPEVKQEVLCACQAGIFEVLKYVNGINGPWYKDSRHVYMSGFVTHWMPLPEPPKED